MALVRKTNTVSTPSTPKKQIIKVNPYENPENVLELMANICSARTSADTDVFWKYVLEAYNKEVRGIRLSTYLTENRSDLWNKDFAHEQYKRLKDLFWKKVLMRVWLLH